MTYEKQIGELRAQLSNLNAGLDEKRTPYLKAQIRLAEHCLDDAEAVLRDTTTAANPASFRTFADLSIHHASQICRTTQDLFKKYGPKLEEI